MKDESKKESPLIGVIGVIGGVGPYAGLDFIQKIFANTLAKKDQDHLSCILVSCPSVIPDRTAYLLQNTEEIENPAYGMFESARRLHSAGAGYVSVACNTAHAGRIFDPFCAMVKKSLPGLEIINMLEACKSYVKESLHKNRLGLLATIGTHSSRVYHEYLREEEGFTLIEPNTDGQKKIHEAIFNEEFGIKAHSSEITAEAKSRIKNEIEGLIEQGAEAVILGCTELPLAVKGQKYSVPLIDPAQITARLLIELTAPDKLLPL